MGSRVGFDFDAGLINDGYSPADRFVAGQLRFLPMRRKDNGTAKSFFIGFSSRDSWGVTSLFGYGQERLGGRLRIGFDWVMSGHGIFGKLFVLWGGR